MPKPLDLSGKTFNNWFVLSKNKTQKGKVYWTCRCEICGSVKMVQASSLISGKSRSCGNCSNVAKIKTQCNFCGKEFSYKGLTSHIWRVHGDGINHNGYKNYQPGTRKAWNKGLTKSTSEAVLKNAVAITHTKSELEQELDDDGKLLKKYTRKKNGDKYHTKYGFELTFQQWCELMKQANIKSSQLGWNGEKYVLARYNDEGPYKIGNCRFITQKENVQEMIEHQKQLLQRKDI